MISERLLDLDIIGPGVTIQERLGGDDHAVKAVTTLCRLGRDECLLNRMRTIDATEALQCHDPPPVDISHGDHARAYAVPIHEHGTGAALAQTAAKFWTIQLQVVTQCVQQRGICRNVQRVYATIHIQLYWQRPAIAH